MNPSHLLIPLLLLSVSCTSRNGNYDASGTFEATEIIVSAQANGEIKTLDLEEGQLFEAGHNVGYIDTIPLYLKKLQLQASTKAVKSRTADISKQIAALQEQITKAQAEKQRAENLLRSNAGTQKQVDDRTSQLIVLNKQLAAQLSTLERSNSSINDESSATAIQVAQTDDQLRKCHINTPITGTILTKYAESGELAASGSPLFKIADIGYLYLRAYIIASQLTQIKLNDKVKVYADFGDSGRREYPGIITWISDKAEFTPKTIQTRDERANLVYAVKVRVKNDGYLKIGMYGDMQLTQTEP